MCERRRALCDTQVLIVNQAKLFCHGAFSTEGGTTCINCTIYLYYRYCLFEEHAFPNLNAPTEMHSLITSKGKLMVYACSQLTAAVCVIGHCTSCF